MTMTETPTNRTRVGRFQHEIVTCEGEKHIQEFTVTIEPSAVSSQTCPRLFLNMEGIGGIGGIGTDAKLVLLEPQESTWTDKTRAAVKKKTVEAWSFSYEGETYRSAHGSRYGTV